MEEKWVVSSFMLTKGMVQPKLKMLLLNENLSLCHNSQISLTFVFSSTAEGKIFSD